MANVDSGFTISVEDHSCTTVETGEYSAAVATHSVGGKSLACAEEENSARGGRVSSITKQGFF